MRKPEQAPEPSIEEILASIRRIIADDAPAAVLAEQDEGVAEQANPYPGVPGSRAGEVGLRAVERRQGEDEVLELTEDFMLAEEAPAMTLQELEEPAEVSDGASYGDPFAERSSDDPYEEAPIGRKPQKPQLLPEAQAVAQEGARDDAGNGLASVMAEVQRFVDIGKAAPPPKAAAKPLENWAQPQNEVFKSDPVPRPQARWSARQTTGEPPKTAEPLPSRPTLVSRDSTPSQKPSVSNRDSWSQGVQMPVPEDGPAIPFAEEGLELPQPSVKPSPAARADRDTAARDETKPAGEQQPASAELRAEPAVKTEVTVAGGAQARAEKIAERAVADFAADKLAAAQPVVAFLKADRPLMEEITGTLATALAKIEDAGEAVEEASPPQIEELGEENVAPELPVDAALAEALKLESFAAAELPRLNIGFMASPSVLPSTPVSAEADVPELPREDSDEITASSHPEIVESASAKAPAGNTFAGNPEAAVTTRVPTPPSQAMARQAPGGNIVREPDIGRLHPSALAPKTLEDTVREMLRPLLVQWLNDNMPRILNDALREEIAAVATIRPRRDDERR